MTCSIPDCGKPAKVRGWCNAHYLRAKQHGDPLGGGTFKGAPLRFLQETVLPYDGNECLTWPFARDCDGYGHLWIGGKSHQVSRLACEEMNGPPPTPDHEAAHSCGKGHEGCVTKRHLDWKTHAENQADKIAHGTHSRGERHPMAKLTEPEVREILDLKGTMFQWEIAERFGVSQPLVSNIHRAKNWNWLEPEAFDAP